MGTNDDDDRLESGEVDAQVHVVVASTRLKVVGEDAGGDVLVVRDLAELLLAVTEDRRMVVLFDVVAPAIDLDLFGRIARDFPSQIAILVRGGGEEARTTLYDAGVYRARCYTPSASAPCDQRDGLLVLQTTEVLDRVRRRLDVPATIPVGEIG